MTGRQASYWTERMIGFGTQGVGGVNPTRAGTTHLSLRLRKNRERLAISLASDG
jgi:succinyl-CoA synthetase alpha subunit